MLPSRPGTRAVTQNTRQARLLAHLAAPASSSALLRHLQKQRHAPFCAMSEPPATDKGEQAPWACCRGPHGTGAAVGDAAGAAPGSEPPRRRSLALPPPLACRRSLAACHRRRSSIFSRPRSDHPVPADRRRAHPQAEQGHGALGAVCAGTHELTRPPQGISSRRSAPLPPIHAPLLSRPGLSPCRSAAASRSQSWWTTCERSWGGGTRW